MMRTAKLAELGCSPVCRDKAACNVQPFADNCFDDVAT